MALPKIQHPLFDFVIPSTGKKTKVRPMLVKEEKILLMAKETQADSDIYNAVKQIVNNCLVDEKIDIDDLAMFDIEYLYLKIRMISMDNIIKLAFRDLDDEQVYDFDIDLNEIEVKFPEGSKKKVEIDAEMGVMLRYPPASLFGDPTLAGEGPVEAKLDKVYAACIEKIYDKDSVYPTKDSTEEELKVFIDDLPIKAFNEIGDFVAKVPTISHELKYTNKMGTERSILLNTLNDFFTLR